MNPDSDQYYQLDHNLKVNVAFETIDDVKHAKHCLYGCKCQNHEINVTFDN